MLIVEHVVLETIRMRLKETFRISSGSVGERRILMVRLVTKDGEGVGECVAGEEPNYSYETVDTATWMLEQHLAPAVIGLEARGRSLDVGRVLLAGGLALLGQRMTIENGRGRRPDGARDSRITEPVRIEEGVTVENSEIGPNITT